ncbi:UDP-N-acetylglucosamine--LPS N-acetylglucosamine transferase [Clostridia bacterium]|nr:UDP-N-acetylglucosamine--LPS N-acetylglucosamine transferase [Clostridia bacterium]
MKRTQKKKHPKICFAASSGGHYEELMTLKPLMEKYPCFILTEKTSYIDKASGRNTFFVLQINRREVLFPVKFTGVALKSLYLFIKERPDVVISTGVLATIPICLIAKLFRKKLIYIESIAKVTDATLSGKLLYRYADQFYVQWESMISIFPKAIFMGGVF